MQRPKVAGNKHLSKAAFLALGAEDTWAKSSFVAETLLCTFGGIPDLYPLDANNSLPQP